MSTKLASAVALLHNNRTTMPCDDDYNVAFYLRGYTTPLDPTKMTSSSASSATITKSRVSIIPLSHLPLVVRIPLAFCYHWLRSCFISFSHALLQLLPSMPYVLLFRLLRLFGSSIFFALDIGFFPRLAEGHKDDVAAPAVTLREVIFLRRATSGAVRRGIRRERSES